MNKMIITNSLLSTAATRDSIDGVDHLVVPVVAICEGVLNETLYSSDEIATFAAAWNGVPIPVGHPNLDGSFISANSPECEATVNIGKFYDVEYVDGKLKGNIWINIEKAERLGFGNIIKHFDDGNMMEVSTGLFSNRESSDGEFNGVKYNAVATNIRPDHLALLPEAVGACSIEDGCGAMRTNMDKIKMAMKVLGKKFGFKANELSSTELGNKLQAAIVEQLGDDHYTYVYDIFGSNVVYEFENQLYRQSYTKNDDKVVLMGDAEMVERKIDYVTVNERPSNSGILNKEDSMNKIEIVAALIGNTANNFEQSDEASLLEMDEAMLLKMTANKDPDGEGAGDGEGADGGDTPAAVEANANVLTPEDMQYFGQLKANEMERVGIIKANVVKHYAHLTDALVNDMSLTALNALAQGIPTVNYAGKGGAGIVEENPEVNTHAAVLLAKTNQENDDGKK